jgi:glycosyltransferase involved in cell wall biosynthesis
MSEDDFGIAQVEVQAAGRPVIALARGGVLDSVIPDTTGVWVKDQTVDALIAAVLKFERLHFASERIQRHAQKFSNERFKGELAQVIDVALRSNGRG